MLYRGMFGTQMTVSDHTGPTTIRPADISTFTPSNPSIIGDLVYKQVTFKQYYVCPTSMLLHIMHVWGKHNVNIYLSWPRNVLISFQENIYLNNARYLQLWLDSIRIITCTAYLGIIYIELWYTVSVRRMLIGRETINRFSHQSSCLVI